MVLNRIEPLFEGSSMLMSELVSKVGSVLGNAWQQFETVYVVDPHHGPKAYYSLDVTPPTGGHLTLRADSPSLLWEKFREAIGKRPAPRPHDLDFAVK